MNGNNAFRARRRTVSLAVSAALALAVFGSAAGEAHAQGFGGGGPGFGRGFGGPGGGRNASPLQSNPMGLLQRPEVQTHLRLTVQQKNQIAELQGQSRDMMRQRMGQVFQQGQQGGGGQDLRNMSREERQQRFEQIRPQMEAAITAYQGELSEKMKAILTPEQAARLRQLDLQRRGILSLADPKVADEVKLTPEHRTQVAQIVTAWQQETGETMRAAFEQARQNNQVPDLDSRLSPTRQKLDRSKKAAEAQVEAVLSPEERAAWDAAIGAKFTFRADPPVQRQQRPGFGGNNRNRGGARQGGFGANGGAFPG